MAEHDDPRRPRGGSAHHDWDASYLQTPPWDIGRPQTPFVTLEDAGGIHGSVLDIGCGTGEHALLAAAHGHPATGVDISPRAIARARAKAAERGLEAAFTAGDALALDDGPTFDTVLDCGFFHVLPDADRPRLAAMLRRVMRAGGTYHLLCFSDLVPGDSGPRRIRQDEIRDAFADGFEVTGIESAYIAATFMPDPVPAWFAHVTRR